MDDIVKAAIKKWPNVPHCYGWLALDARGDWYLRDEATQAAGPFPESKGSRVVHDKLREFIGRNYEHDERGAWFFQNGPQRVYLQLEAAPWVLGVQRCEGGVFDLSTHIGQAIERVDSVWLDELGRLFLATERGLGLVRSLDMDAAADALGAGVWGEPQEVAFAALPERFGYQLNPQP
ncbi:DUF2946 family protein [Aquabacterium sp.]|uniref:DUF2946 family protein n=1 Tax=Aquabacterium sp. TaxID=1872578 RepID=UPI002E332BCF|nr:DUF2946 family protein [Aquabacterium sp.]HEX5311942.1 DUF2946 family protein [Aquabacterium sp.]